MPEVRRVVNQTIIFFVLVLLMVGVRAIGRALSFDPKPYLQNLAKESGVDLDYRSLSWSFPLGVTCEGLGLNFPVQGSPIKVPLAVSSLNVSLPFLNLLSLSTSPAIDAQLYSGSLTVQELSDPAAVEVVAKDIQLGEYPMTKLLALSGALSLNFTIQKSLVDSSGLGDGGGEIQIENGNYGGGHTVGGVLKLPPAKDIAFHGALERKGAIVLLKNFTVKSSLGDIEATGSAKLKGPQWERLNLGGKIALSEEGKKTFGGYLALAAQTDVTKPVERWDFSVEALPGRQPNVKVTPQ